MDLNRSGLVSLAGFRAQEVKLSSIWCKPWSSFIARIESHLVWLFLLAGCRDQVDIGSARYVWFRVRDPLSIRRPNRRAETAIARTIKLSYLLRSDYEFAQFVVRRSKGNLFRIR